MNSQTGNNNAENNEEREETVAERSARLEAEAQALYEKQADLPGGDDTAAAPEEGLAPEAANPADAETAQPVAEGNPGKYEAQIESLKAELAKTKDQMMRVAADAENTKRRALRDRDDAGKFAIQGFAKDLVNVADNLRRALDAVPDDLKEDVRVSNLTEGIEATERELLRSFEKNGIQKINPQGEVFDPNFHEVMFEAPVPGQAPGTIIEVVETGYTLHGRILRPARVGVAKDDGQGGGQPPPATDPGANFDGEA